MSTSVRPRTWLLVLGLLLPPALAPAQADSADQAVRRVIESAYVTGVFVTRDTATVRRGFHPGFVLSVLDDGEVIVVTLDEWLDHLELDGRRSTDAVRHEFDYVDVTGNTATAKLRLYINGQQEYTDYLSLYRFPDGWRIVNKVFQDHE